MIMVESKGTCSCVGALKNEMQRKEEGVYHVWQLNKELNRKQEIKKSSHGIFIQNSLNSPKNLSSKSVKIRLRHFVVV